ncbi:chemotaxis protein [Anaeromyxobacter dehalogenans]|uniref:Methyl-accepting chemotaxis sensory transducer n=1 Tax=Anaeromyxobacter dehalogenans (strain 2CP-C) TaxID=290397 RepID=Q2IQR6_ANADE|nr:chemotaxis protein [Anaeromyxobacter dehalogenans]ABC81150.1 methyl-accepting chemotaxis sensory transducer [Anaeromyxobacter dehalogenans 2CP-C]
MEAVPSGPAPEAPAALLEATRAQLRGVAERLSAFLHGSEDVFLEAGQRLGALAGRARGMVDAARRAAGPGDAEDGADPGAVLAPALERLASYLGDSRAGAARQREALERVGGRADALAAAGGALADVPRTLRALGVSTRIENCRAEVPNAGVETVASDVRRLADDVEARFAAMVARAGELARAVAAARGAAEAFAGRERAWSDRMLADTQQALAALRALAAAQAGVVAGAADASAGIAASASSVVVGLQGHDATRQILEHAAEALRAFDAEAGGGRAGEAPDAPAWLAEAAGVCRLAGAQLGGARARLLEALEAIRGSLGAMASRADALGRDLGLVAGDGVEGSPVARVERGVGAATLTLAEHLAQARAGAESARRVAEAVGGIAEQVRATRAIGHAVKIIALNALVETERAGVGGRVLAVLAREIQLLAAEVVRRTDEVSASLGAITSAAAALEVDRSAAAATEGEALSAALGALVARLGARHLALAAGTRRLREDGAALRREVDEVAARLARQLELARGLDALERELASAGARAAAGAGAAAPAARAAGRAALERYTMSSERDVHARVTGEGAIAPAAARGGAPSAGQDLGANVELF